MLQIKVLNAESMHQHKQLGLTSAVLVGQECFIGRATNCDLVLPSPSVSRLHGKISLREQQYYYVDLASRGGSRINNIELKASQFYQLHANDLIRIGEFVLMVEQICIPDPVPTEEEAAGCDPIVLTQLPRWQGEPLIVRCLQVIDETPSVRTLSFAATPPVLFTYQPGQRVALHLDLDGRRILHLQAISSSPSRPHTLELTVANHASEPGRSLLPDQVAHWLYHNIEVGSILELGSLKGCSLYFAHPASKRLLVCDDGGIASMVSVLRWIHDTLSPCQITLCYCVPSPRDIVFRAELELMARRQPNLRLAIVVAQPDRDWMGLTGPWNEAMLRLVVADLHERHVFVCGSDGLKQTTRAILQQQGFLMQQYHEENVGAAANLAAASQPSGYT